MIKPLIQNVLNSCGYQVSRISTAPEYTALDLLALTVECSFISKNVTPYVLQIGANDGVRADPIHELLVEHRWPGLLVEPQPAAFQRLRENYRLQPQLILEQCVIFERNVPSLPLYTVLDESEGGPSFRWTGLARFDRGSLLSELTKSGFNNASEIIKEVPVPAMTIQSLLSKHNVDRVDILAIDAEGYDFEIIKMMNLDESGPEIIFFELLHLAPTERSECFEHLSRHGYSIGTQYGDALAYRSRTSQSA